MPYRSTLIAIIVMVTVASGIFLLFQQRTSQLWLKLAIHPEIQSTLTRAAEDQKELAKLDPENTLIYRTRFEEIQAIRNNLFILETHGREVVTRFQQILMCFLLVIVGVATVYHVLIQRKIAKRIAQLRQPLAALAEGSSAINLPTSANDIIGKVARMIGQTAEMVTQQREKLRYLEHLSGWQEASRRHAHEIRTPLTAARLEIERMEELLEFSTQPSSHQNPLKECAQSILEELDRIKRFTQEFTAFARLREPQTESTQLTRFLSEFCTLFAKAWPNLTLQVQLPTDPVHPTHIDQEMIRQVLVNLANNASKSMNKPMGNLSFALFRSKGKLVLEVCDDGPGIPENIKARIFEPYSTTRKIGEGMGLGLSISRKIMLDHQGDLLLTATSCSGTCFQMLFPETQIDVL